VDKEFGAGSNDYENTMSQLNHVEHNHHFMKMAQESYNYMLDRMKRDLISYTLTINDLTESLRSKKMITDDETAKCTQSREQKLQSEFRLQQLMKSLEHDQRKRQERITSLNMSIKNKELAIQKRNERKLNQ